MSQPVKPVKHSCEECVYLRHAPYEARRTGCFNPKFMPGKQKDAFLDEQQIPGDHEVLNRNGDCPEWTPIPPRPSLVKRLFSLRD